MCMCTFISLQYDYCVSCITDVQALEYCSMEHILCLWTILSVEMAKRLLRTKQVAYMDSSILVLIPIFNSFSQEPFTGLNDDYLLPINQKDQIEKLNEFLQNTNVEEFLHLLFEFIEGFIKHSQDYIKGNWWYVL